MPILIASANITNYLDTKESVTQPTNPVEGQKWRDESQTPPILKVYKNGAWINYETSLKEQDPNLWDELQTEVNAAKQAGEEAKEAGERAEQLGNEAKQVGEEAKQAGEAAKAEAELARQAGEDAKVAGQRAESLAGQAKTESATAITNANNAVNKANQAVEDADFSKTQAQDAKQLADAAKQDALNAVSQSDTAKQIAESASSAASGAVTTANQAKQDALNAIGQAGTAVTDAKAALDAYNNMEIGGRNLLKGTGDMSENIQAGTVDTTETLNGNNSVKRPFVSGSADTYGGTTTIPVNGTEYTITFWAKADRTIGFRNYFYLPDTTTKVVSSSGETNTNNNGETYFTATTEWKKYWITWTQTPTTEIKRILLGRLSSAGTIWINSPMLVEGNVPMPWSPAPEDVQTQIISINGELSQKVSQTTFNTLQGTVSSQGTQINQNKSDIALKANQSTVNTLTGRVSTAEGQITAQAGQIAQRLTSDQVETLVNGKGYATQTSVNSQVSTINGKLNEHTSQLQTVTATVDGMQSIGGQNLIEGAFTKTGVSWQSPRKNSPDGTGVANHNDYNYLLRMDITSVRNKVEVGDIITISFDVKMDNGESLSIYDTNNSIGLAFGRHTISNIGNKKQRIFFTKKLVSNTVSSSTWVIDFYNNNNNDKFTITNVKIEKGSIATDFSLSPADTATVAEVTSKTNALSQRISENENRITAVVGTATTQGSKITSLESRVNIAEGVITTTNTKVTSNTNQIGTLQSSFSGLQSTVSSITQEVAKKITDERYITSNTGSADYGKWTLFAQTTIPSRYQDIQCGFDMVGFGNSDKNVRTAELWIRHKQQMEFGVAPEVELALVNAESFTADDFKAVIIQNNAAGSVVYYYVRIRPPYTSLAISPFNKTGIGIINFRSSQPFATALPSGSTVNAVERGNLGEISKTNTSFSDFKQDVNGFKQTVQSTYATQTSLNTVSQTVNSTTQTIASMQTDLNGKATVTALNSVKTTVDSHTQTISNHNGRITTAQQTADGAKTTATDAQGRVATVEQKVTGLQTTVADKADKSQITQLSGQISSVVSDVSKKITDESFYTSNTDSSNSGRWTLFAQTTLTSRFNDVQCGFDLIGTGPGNSLVYSAELFIRHKQQDVLGGSTLVEIALSNASVSAITTDDFKAVVIQNSTASVTVNYYMRINNTYLRFKVSPFNKISRGTSYFNFYEYQAFIESLPTGTTFTATERGVMAGLSGAKSQITQLASDINLRVTKAGLIGEINVSAGKTIIRQSDNVVMITPTTTYIQDATIKNAHIADLAVTNAKIANLTIAEGKIANAAITTLKVADAAISNAKIANLAVDGAKIASLAVDTGHIKDLAVSNAKIANLAISNAKIADAAITSAKIGDAAIVNAKIANGAINDAKIQDASISSAKIISLDANKISANELRSISSQTGALEVTGWLDFSTENRGLRGTYNFGDSYGGAYNPRWFDGDLRMSHRYLMFKSQVYDVTSSDTRGNYRYHTESFYGPDYLKLRQHSNSSMTTLLNHVDITADAIIIGDRDWATRARINADGTAMFNGRGVLT